MLNLISDKIFPVFSCLWCTAFIIDRGMKKCPEEKTLPVFPGERLVFVCPSLSFSDQCEEGMDQEDKKEDADRQSDDGRPGFKVEIIGCGQAEHHGCDRENDRED